MASSGYEMTCNDIRYESHASTATQQITSDDRCYTKISQCSSSNEKTDTYEKICEQLCGNNESTYEIIRPTDDDYCQVID